MTHKAEDAILVNPPAEISLKDKALAELNVIDAGIARLKEQHDGKVYAVATTVGMKEASKARMSIRECRYKVPTIVDNTKKQLKVIAKNVEAEGERIIAALLEIETPIHEQIKSEEERKQKEKEEKAAAEKLRKDNILSAIRPFHTIVTEYTGRNSDDLKGALELTQGAELTEDKFQEFYDEGVMAKNAAVAGLQVLLDKALASEEEARRLAAERAELEEMKRKLEEIAAADQKRIEEERAAAEKERQAEREKFEQEQARVRAEMKAEQERQQAELAEKMKAAQAEQERQQAEAEKQQAAAQAEIDRQRAELEEAQRIQREKEEAEQKKKDKEAENERVAELLGLNDSAPVEEPPVAPVLVTGERYVKPVPPVDPYEHYRFTGVCSECGQPFYKEAFDAARAFIDSHIADPDITDEMRENFYKYQAAIERLDRHQREDHEQP